MKRATAIMETAIYAEDIDAAEVFYRDVFGLEVVQKVEGAFVFLKCGQQMLLVFNPARSARPDPAIKIPRHGATGAGHFCFYAKDDAELTDWKEHFQMMGVGIERDHLWQDGGRSIYVRDPAGNSVEVGEAKIWGFD